VFSVGINRAVSLIAEAKTKGRGPRGGQALKELGAHPQSGAMVKVMKGRYGPYVSDGKLNATLSRDSDPAAVTMDEAVALLEARAAREPTNGKRRGKKSAAPKSAAPKEAKPEKKAKAKAPASGNGVEKLKRKAKAASKATPTTA
jgi:DNA topoisomerase-1